MDEWEALIEEIRSCTKCDLHRTRRNPVPGEGPRDARLMFVGEAPGQKEDEEGRPFVGAAGKLLTELLERNGIKRSEVYITNVVKCRPPGNRDPTEEEVAACSPYLFRQIMLIKPKIIVCLGRHSARLLFSEAGLPFRGISSARGKPHNVFIRGVPVTLFATYHPAAALYNPRLRSILEKDFETIGKLYKSDEGLQHKRSTSLLDFLK